MTLELVSSCSIITPSDASTVRGSTYLYGARTLPCMVSGREYNSRYFLPCVLVSIVTRNAPGDSTPTVKIGLRYAYRFTARQKRIVPSVLLSYAFHVCFLMFSVFTASYVFYTITVTAIVSRGQSSGLLTSWCILLRHFMCPSEQLVLGTIIRKCYRGKFLSVCLCLSHPGATPSSYTV